MARRVSGMALAAVLVTMLWSQAMAQPGCTSAIVGLMPCLNYITGNSSTPSSSCCTQLASVVQTQAQCLCTVLSGGASSLGITINQTQALALPGACKVQTPPLSQCSAVAPASSPAESPKGSEVPSSPSTPSVPSNPSPTTTPSTPSTPSTPAVPSSGSGSKTVPSTNGTSDGFSTKLNIFVFFILLFIASHASVLTNF